MDDRAVIYVASPSVHVRAVGKGERFATQGKGGAGLYQFCEETHLGNLQRAVVYVCAR